MVVPVEAPSAIASNTVIQNRACVWAADAARPALPATARCKAQCAMSDMAKAAATIQPTDRAWQVLEGAYDLQVHVGPDVIARRIDDIDCAKECLAHGMKGFVLKSHYVQTGERAQVVAKAVPGSRVFGALTLNHSVGGLNPVAIELAGRTGCKGVWMPTVGAPNEPAGRSDGRAEGGSTKLPFWAEIQR